jgi:Tol biopolymer transport system component
MRRISTTVFLLLLALTLTAQSPRELFERARMIEETNNRLMDAIALYTQVASQSVDRQLAATAQLRIGLLHERLGQKEDAQRAFKIVVDRYADQIEAARQAQAKLPASAAAASTAPAARRLWAGPDVELSGAVSPDGKYVSYVDWETGDLAVRDLVSGTRRRLTGNPSFNQAAGFAQESSISPDGKQIAYAWFHDDGMDLRVIGVDGGAARVLVDGAGMPIMRVSWGGGPKHIAVSHQAQGRTHRLAMVNAATGAVRALKTLDWRAPARIALSPDGRYLAYDFPPKEDAPNRDIYVLAVDGSREAIVVEHAANDLFPVWTPDGTHLVFVSDRTGTAGLWAVPVADGRSQGPAKLFQPLGDVYPLGFSRSGGLYYGLRTGTGDAYVAAIDVATGRVLEPPRAAARQVMAVNSRPRWSPDGRSLVYQADRVRGGGFGARRLILQSMDTGQERDLNVPLPYFQRAEWSPDGRSVLLQARSPKGSRGFFRFDITTGAMSLAIPRPDGQGYAPSWAPDGRSVFFTGMSGKGRAIVEYSFESAVERVLYPAPTGQGVGDSSISPDGRWLAFAEGGSTIKVVAVQGGEAREITRVEPPDAIPGFGGINWTRDSQFLLFVRATGARGDDRAVWKVPVTGGAALKTELQAKGMRDLHLHPDGRRVAFTAGEGSDELWVLDRLLPLNGASKTAATRLPSRSR